MEEALERGLDHGAKREGIPSGDQMDRRTKETHADGFPIRDERGEVLGPEVLDPAPQRHVRVGRDLSLHPDQSLNRRGSREVRSL